jgi:hypothetical protein
MPAPTQLTPFTQYPQRSNPTTFYDDGDIFFSELASRIIGWNAQTLENNVAVNTTTQLVLVATQQASISNTKALEAEAQKTIATTKANESSASAASALASKNAIAELITLLPADINLAYSKADVDSKLELIYLENFLEFKF